MVIVQPLSAQLSIVPLMVTSTVDAVTLAGCFSSVALLDHVITVARSPAAVPLKVVKTAGEFTILPLAAVETRIEPDRGRTKVIASAGSLLTNFGRKTEV